MFIYPYRALGFTHRILNKMSVKISGHQDVIDLVQAVSQQPIQQEHIKFVNF